MVLKLSAIFFPTLCLAVLASVTPSLAQSLPGGRPARRLTLHEALERAHRQNLELAAMRLRHAVSQAGVQIARQLPNPTFNFAAMRDVPHEGIFFDQPLELGGKRHRRVEFAQQQVLLTDVEIDTFARQIRRRVRAAYFAAAHARGFTARRAQALELARRVREIAQARFGAGDVPHLEVLQAELEAARAEAELTVAQQQEKVAFTRLNVLLNEPADGAWDLDSDSEGLPPEIPLPDLVLRAQASNPDLQHLAQEKRVEESHRALLSAERVPTFTVQFGTDFNAPREFRVGPRGALSFNVPIFARNQGELTQSLAALQVITSEMAATRRAIAGRVEAAYYEWSTRKTQVDLYRRTLLPVAQKLESLAEESYRAGRANILTVLDAQRNVQQVQRDYLDSLLALQSAFADLEETVGTSLD